jgi:RimJ/RimL family protein N-acetyltransferase
MIDQKSMMNCVFNQLAIDLNCSPDDFLKDGIICTVAKENPGRRPFPRGKRHFEMWSFGNSVIVTATEDILPYIRKQLNGKTRDEAFMQPFVYGQALYYLPELTNMVDIPLPKELSFEMVEKSDIPSLYEFKGFDNALKYDINNSCPDVLVTLAKYNDKVIGVAGAFADCEKMWEIGMDVVPEFRGKGIAASLANSLKIEILNRGIIPYYGTSSSNIASQKVANRAGFKIAWVFSHRFNGIE